VLTVVSAAAGGNTPGMTTAGEPRRLALEVRFDAEPIEGRLYDHEPGGRLDRPFSGWLGLLAAIEAARGTGGRPSRQEREEAR
jgi:hypothetical protein